MAAYFISFAPRSSDAYKIAAAREKDMLEVRIKVTHSPHHGTAGRSSRYPTSLA
jgi:hypothetical protein